MSGLVLAGGVAQQEDNEASVYSAMMLGLRDYVKKNGFPGVLIGLSGGIDSALTAAVAVDALGSDNVHCLMMPSPYTSIESLEDAASCAEMLGVRLDEINIGPAMEAFDRMTASLFEDAPSDTTEREHSVPLERSDSYGSIKQNRIYGRFNWQQVGNVGWLRNALWRYVRRILCFKRRL